MKILFKILGIALLALLLIILILGLTQPKDVSVERTIVIKAPQAAVLDQITNFKNWTNWSPWIAKEPKVKLTYQGVDGQVGSSYHWKGDESGEGEMTSTTIVNGTMTYTVQFLKPWKGASEGYLATEAINANETKVLWHMTLHGTFPFNAFNYFMDKIIGTDFEDGLELLKNHAEAHPVAGLSMNSVEEIIFAAQSYASIRKTIPWTEMQSFSSSAFDQLSKAAGSRMMGTAATFYFSWNDTTQSTDMAPAYPVSGNTDIKGVVMMHVPAMHNCRIVYTGGYGLLGKAHEVLGQYIVEKHKKLNYTFEEYVKGPFNEPDSNKWVTTVNYLVD